MATLPAPKQVFSTFPNLELLTPKSDSDENFFYKAIAKKAAYEFDKFEELAKIPDQIDALAKTWTERSTVVCQGNAENSSKEDLRKELTEKGMIAAKYKITKEDLKERVLPLYDRTIQALIPPPLDLSTLQVLAKMKVNMKDFTNENQTVSGLKTRFDDIFVVKRGELTEQRAKLAELAGRIGTSLLKLKEAAEPLALHLYNWENTSLFSRVGIPSALSIAVRSTPNFDVWRNKALTLLKSQPKEQTKE